MTSHPVSPEGGEGARVEHTPGPWVSGPHLHERASMVYAGDYSGEGEPDLIVEIVSEHHRDDARLIAAAPELLAVARDLVAYHTGDGLKARTGSVDGCSNCGSVPHRVRCHVAVAEAAIARAIGK